MSKSKKTLLFVSIMLFGVIILWGMQQVFHKTNNIEFCVGCHSMNHAQAEWEGSSHFSNRKGIRAECSDCHVPNDGLHYVKAKVIALKDVWYEITGKIDTPEKYEQRRLEMAERVWKDLKENDSMTCRSCHSFDAMLLSEQSKSAKEMHKQAQETKQTCIDCHKGIVHFMPDIPVKEEKVVNINQTEAISNNDSILYVNSIIEAQLEKGGDIRLMPYSELIDWTENKETIIATIKGWQQVGAESIVYQQLGKRITVAVLGDEEKDKVNVLQQVHDEVTGSDWREVMFKVSVPRSFVTANITKLNQIGNNLNQTHCSACHSAIGAEHYTANQWIGVVNSMKDRTSMTSQETRTLTLYLQRHAKDIVSTTH